MAVAARRIGLSQDQLPEVVNITPRIAEEWLKTMVANRPISQKNVIEFAEAMYDGRWSLNGETIKFDDQARLFDGQNRLQACLLAGVPFRSYVITGIEDENAFATVDTGKARTNADVFAIAGWQNNKIAAGAAFLLYLYENKRMGWTGPIGKHSKGSEAIAARVQRGVALTTVSREELHSFAKGVEERLQQAVRFANSAKASRILPSASVAALYFLFSKISIKDAESFFNDLGEGVGILKGDPVYVLREKLIGAKMAKAVKLNRFAIIGLSLKAWNKRRDGSRIQVLGIQNGEAFPAAK